MCTEVMVQFGHCEAGGCKFLQHVGMNEACYMCKNPNDNHRFEQLLL
jgi:hypothetical protein